jgi:NAD dependent epimerase/dehydratase family enzyme
MPLHRSQHGRDLRSRVDSTRAVGSDRRGTAAPRVWLQASTATIYADRYDAPNDEMTGIIGGTEPDVPAYWAFSIKVATEWETALAAAGVPRTRRVAMRSAMVMSPDPGGIFDTLMTLVRRGLGGQRHFTADSISWVHEEDS